MKKYFILFTLLFCHSQAYSQQILNLDTVPTVDGSDVLYIIDVSDSTDREEGTGKKTTVTGIVSTVASTSLSDTADIIYETELDTEAELEGQLTDVANVIISTEIDTFAELDALVADKSIVTTDNTQPLTNKTINTASNTITIVEADISDLSHTTDTNLTEEEVEDFAGGMWTGNTETNITITYQDADGTIDAVIDSAVTLDTEWDTFAEINAATTDTDAVLDTDIGSTVQAYDADLDSISGLTPSSSLIRGDGLGGYETVTQADFITENSILTDIVSDTTPDLGGDLDLKGYMIESESGGIQFDSDDDTIAEAIITSAGNVGIGSSVPQSVLDVAGSVYATDYYGDGSNLTGISGGEVATWTEDHDMAGFMLESSSSGIQIDIDDDSIAEVVFAANGDFKIDGSGNLGLGTTTPSAVLHIAEGILILEPTDAPPTCDATQKGGQYYDDSLSELCDCNGTSWAQVDGGGAC